MRTQYVLFSRGISDESVNQLFGTLYSLINDCDEVYLLLNSNGGNVNAGIHCYNMLRSLPIVLTTHNVGNVDSIANTIFLAGEKRYVAASASFMFHGVVFNKEAPFTLDEKACREHLDSITSDHNRIGQIFAGRSLVTLSESSELFLEQRRKGPEWAIEKQFAHEICPAQIPPEATLQQLT